MDTPKPPANPAPTPPPSPEAAAAPSGPKAAVNPEGQGTQRDKDNTPLPISVQALLATEITEAPVPSSVTFFRSALEPPGELQAPSAPRLDDFRLLRKLGEGAMGTVYKARQASINRDVAVKVLFPHVARNPRLRERFYREARVMGLLDHPNLVRGYAVGETGGWHYLAMEYIDGRSLQKWLNLLGTFTVGDALYTILNCARALEYIHGQNLVHRDIKPDNVLIARTGVMKVTDLGVAKSLDEELSLTQTGNSVGTPFYMPLEQARNSKDVDGRSDIYALGCMLYCCLTGRPPFTGATLLELIEAKEAGRFLPARRFNPHVPERLDLIIDKMVAKQVRHRYRTCAEVIRDLEGLRLAAGALSFIPSGESRETAVSQAVATVSAEAAETASSSEKVAPPPKVVAADWWYVCYKTIEGQTVTQRLTTIQVLKLLEDESFDPGARASRGLKDSFLPLAWYGEFEHHFLDRASQTAVDESTSQIRHLYQKFDEADRNRPEAEAEEIAPPDWRVILTWLGTRGLFLCFLVLVLRWLYYGLAWLFDF